MAIKSDITKTQKDTPAYPKLMVSSAHDQIVLMLRYGAGVVVHGGTSKHDVGFFSDTWIMTQMRDFTGEVTLSND